MWFFPPSQFAFKLYKSSLYLSAARLSYIYEYNWTHSSCQKMMPRGAPEQAVTSGGPLFLASFILHSKQSVKAGDRVCTHNLCVLPTACCIIVYTHDINTCVSLLFVFSSKFNRLASRLLCIFFLASSASRSNSSTNDSLITLVYSSGWLK